MKISALSKPRAVTVDFQEDGTLNVVYDPMRLTPELESKLTADGKDRSSQELVESILYLVHEWDLEDDDGVIPLERERLVKLPIAALAAVVSAVGEDAAKTAKEQGKALAATSQQADG
jgi:hypothetical protein